MNRNNLNFIYLFLYLFLSLHLYAQDDLFDLNFGINGIKEIDFYSLSSDSLKFGTNQNITTDFCILKNGDIIGIGKVFINSTPYIFLIKLDKNGNKKNNFNNGNFVFFNPNPAIYYILNSSAVEIQSDNKILICGSFYSNAQTSDFVIARFDSLGNIDSTFATNGIYKLENVGGACDLKIQNDGKILFFVSSRIMRLNSNGQLDKNFGENGVVVIDDYGELDLWTKLNKIAIQEDGKILLAGQTSHRSWSTGYEYKDFILIRLTQDGAYDLSFDENGVLRDNLSDLYDQFLDVIVLNDQKILCLGKTAKGNAFNITSCLIKYNVNGTRDTTFGLNGIVYTDFSNSHGETGYSLALQKSNKIIVSGTISDSGFVCRFLPNGEFDSTFGKDGVKIINSTSGEIKITVGKTQENDKILLYGGLFNRSNYPSHWNIIFIRLNGITNIIPIKLSYFFNNSETIIDTLLISIGGSIGNLSFLKYRPSPPIKIPAKYNYTNSHTFVVLDQIYNNNELIKKIDNEIFELPNEFNVFKNFLLKKQILFFDNDTTDNIIIDTLSIWTANFTYQKDNFSFSNWKPSKSNIGKIIIDGVKYFVYPLSIIVDYLSNTLSENGYCYGISTTSIMYKYFPGKIPNGLFYAFQVSKDNALDDIYKFQENSNNRYTKDIYYYFKDQKRGANQLDVAKTLLSENKITLANYDHHSTVLHTIIKYKNKYHLFEYDNNYDSSSDAIWKYGPHKRGYFKVFNNKEIYLYNKYNEKQDIFDFEFPKIIEEMNYINNVFPSNIVQEKLDSFIIDSLITLDLKYLKENELNVIFFIISTNSDENIQIIPKCNIIDSLILGPFISYYYKNSEKINFKIIPKTEHTLNIYNINTFNSDPFLNIFYNIYFPDKNGKAYLSSIDINDSLLFKIDLDDDGTIDKKITSSFFAKNFQPSNYPPKMINDLPLFVFSDSLKEFHMFLLDYFYDEYLDSLNFEIKFDSTYFSAKIEQNFLIVSLLNYFTNSKQLNLIVKDNLYQLSIPIFAQCDSTLLYLDSFTKEPLEFSLTQNYPNPFNPSTTISYSIPKVNDVKLIIYNILGEKVRTLLNKKQNAGKYSIIWNGKDDFGKPVSSGIYLYQLKCKDFVQSKKMILLR